MYSWSSWINEVPKVSAAVCPGVSLIDSLIVSKTYSWSFKYFLHFFLFGSNKNCSHLWSLTISRRQTLSVKVINFALVKLSSIIGSCITLRMSSIFFFSVVCIHLVSHCSSDFLAASFLPLFITFYFELNLRNNDKTYRGRHL